MNKISIRRLLRGIYGFTFFNKMTLLTPVYAVFMQSHGLSDAALAMMLMIYPIATLLTQMPATWITLRIGRKYAIILGQVLKCIGFILWALCPSYIGFAAGMFLWGVQYAFVNVSLDAVLYDELAARRAGGIYTRALGIKYAVSSAGIAMSAFGSLMMFAGYGWVTAMSVLALVVSMVCIGTVRILTPRARIAADKMPGMLTIMRIGVRACCGRRCLPMLMMVALMVANFAFLDDYFGPIGTSIGLPVEYVGILPLLLLGASILGQVAAYRFAKMRQWILYAAVCAGGALFMAFGAFYSVWGLGLLGLAYMLFGALNVLLYANFQNAIPTHFRSVLLSFYNIGSNVAYVLINIIIGIGSEMGGWRFSIIILGACLMLIGLWAALFITDDCASAPAPVVRASEFVRPGVA